MAAPSKRLLGLLEELSATLQGLPNVFSTPQWGGRAYKLPGPGGSTAKPKLVAFVGLDAAAGAVEISFKLPPPRAKEVRKRHSWIVPHSFATLAPSGWLTARLTTKRQLATLKKLLAESRSLFGTRQEVSCEPARTGSTSGAIARRIDRVMRELKEEGRWKESD